MSDSSGNRPESGGRTSGSSFPFSPGSGQVRRPSQPPEGTPSETSTKFPFAPKGAPPPAKSIGTPGERGEPSAEPPPLPEPAAPEPQPPAAEPPLEELYPAYRQQASMDIWSEPPEPAEPWPPWEDAQRGFLDKLWDSFSGTSFSPVSFFSRCYPDAQPAWGYAFAAGFVGGIISSLANIVLNQLGAASMGYSQGTPVSMGLGICCGAIFLGVFTVVGVLVSAGLFHLSLLVLGGAQHGFQTTLTVVSYANGTAMLWLTIPVLGIIPSTIYAIVLPVIGLHKLHECDVWKAVIAVLIPLIAMAIALFVLISMLIAAMFAAVAGGGGI